MPTLNKRHFVQRYGLGETFGVNVERNLREFGSLKGDFRIYGFRQKLILLVLTLACTPAYHLSGLKQVLVLRRLLGLYTFAYASLHFLNFVGLDYGFNFALIWEDIGTKRFVLVGFSAFLLLLALAGNIHRGVEEAVG